MRPLLAALAVAATIVSGCASTSTAESARDRWESLGHRDFVLEFDSRCIDEGCGFPAISHALTYRDGDPVAGTFRRPQRERDNPASPIMVQLLPTIDELFSLADDDTVFDEATGLPASVQRGDLVFDAIDLVFDVEQRRQEIAEVRATWAATGLTEYRLSYRCAAGCERPGRVDLERRGDTAIPLNRDLLDTPSSVEEILDLVDRYLGDAPDVIELTITGQGFLRRATMIDDGDVVFEIRNIQVDPLDD